MQKNETEEAVKEETKPDELKEDAKLSDVLAPIPTKYTKRVNLFKRIMAGLFPFLNLAVVIIIIYFAMKTDGISARDFFGVSVNGWYILAASAVFVVTIFVGVLRLQMTMSVVTKQYRPMLCLRTHLLERHYDLLTPYYTGGKAHTIYYLSKNKFHPSEAVAIFATNYIIGRIAFSLTTGIIFAALISRAGQLGGEKVVASAIWGGFAFQILATAGILFVCLNKKIPRKIVMWLLKLLNKIKIIKNLDKAKHNVEEAFERHQQAMKKIIKNPKFAIASIFAEMCSRFLYYFIIVFIYSALFGWDSSAVPLLLLGIVLTENISAAMPIPGGTGAMELFFLSAFAGLFGTPQIIVALIIWKIFSYIVPIVTGIPVVVHDSIKRIREAKSKKTKNRD